MTAKQFLLVESTYCRERAANCADRYHRSGAAQAGQAIRADRQGLGFGSQTKFATMPGEPRV